MLVFRNGNDNMAYGNIFIDSGEIRVKEANNIYCFNNYFENSGIGGRAGSVNFDYVAGNLQNIKFLFNTFINSAPISLGGNGALLSRWSNNLFSNKSGPIFQDSNQGTKWLGNIYQGSSGLGSLSGLKLGAAKYTKKINDVYRLEASSVARFASVPGFALPAMYPGLEPASPLSRDIFKNLRPQKVSSWDVGALQYVKVPARVNWLTPKTTGPRYL